MAFASGPVSFQRFFVDGALPSDVTDRFVQALNARAFGKLAALADDTQLGWIGPRHLFETEIAAAPIAFGRFVHFALRIDRLRVPPNVLRAYVRIEEEAAMQERGREFLNRSQRQRAREAALLRADKEAKDGAFRRMNAYPVLVDLETRQVFLGNLSGGVADKFMHLFAETFGCGLEPADPQRIAVRALGSTRRARSIDNLSPCHFVRPPSGFEGNGADAALPGLRFVGREFLTWLWYQTEAADEALQLNGGTTVTLMLDHTLRMQCDFGLTGTDVITAEGPTRLPEARAALRTGKQPTKAGLVVGTRDGEFRLTLDGPRLAVSSLTVPQDDAENDPRAALEQRFERVADAAHLLDALLELFLQRRTASDWDREVRTISKWISNGSKNGRPRVVSA